MIPADMEVITHAAGAGMAGSCAKLTERAAFLAALVVGVLTLHGGAVEAARGGDTAAQPAAPEQSYTNRLIQSNNPYLLLHAHNPVDWYPWGPEALARAKRENRPIFVSIGYSTCYWCHVAERTIYSDPEIAKLMNEWFINIKVDREQRPDLDRIHMLATHLLTGRGGWPNNVFLTPDLKPFFAGSYFPPADDAFGRPGFPTVLKAIHEAWVGRRQEMQEQADKVYSAMLDAQAPATSGAAVSVRPSDWLRVARNELLQTYDATHGGLGRGRQKFPQAPALRLLLADYRSSRDAKVLEAVTKTLNAMAFGGIHDHLGGGFHRYSTEATWSIPHFEKMLYDNAQLLQIYAEAYQITRDPLYREVAEEVAAYLSQQMMAPEGGFYAAQDAEVAGREGISYLWTRDEIESVLGKVAAERFLQVYTLTPLPGQSEADLVAGADTGVLRIRVPIVDTLQRAGGGNIVEVLASQAQARAGLLAARNRRPQPARDDKIIIAWNGMAIEALVRSGEILGNGAYVGLAKLTAGRLWNLAYEPGTGEMKREIFRGRAQTHGFLDDYALMGVAFLSLGEATGEPVWRKRAASVAAAMLRRFSDGDALATTVAAKQLLLSPEDDGDNSYPSGISAAVELLSRLYAVSGDAQYARAASRIAMHLGRVVEQSPVLWPVAVAALNRYPLPARQAASPQALGAADYAPSTADHVRVRGEVRSARGRDEIVVTIVVDGGYHINANPATFDYLIPTAVSIEGVPDMQIAYPAPRLIKPKFAPDGLKVYEGTITLRGVAAKGALAGAKSISATVRVQACNDQVCLPPATLPLKLTRRATPSSR